jgi:hypothetical protein
MSHPSHRQDIGIEAVEQGGIGKQIELKDVAGAQGNAQRLDAPARRTGKRAVEMLHEHQPDHRMREPGGQHRPHRKSVDR